MYNYKIKNYKNHKTKIFFSPFKICTLFFLQIWPSVRFTGSKLQGNAWYIRRSMMVSRFYTIIIR